MWLYCDNKSTINIAHNSIQHDCRKHIEVYRYFLKEKFDDGLLLFANNNKLITCEHFHLMIIRDGLLKIIKQACNG